MYNIIREKNERFYVSLAIDKIICSISSYIYTTPSWEHRFAWRFSIAEERILKNVINVYCRVQPSAILFLVHALYVLALWCCSDCLLYIGWRLAVTDCVLSPSSNTTLSTPQDFLFVFQYIIVKIFGKTKTAWMPDKSSVVRLIVWRWMSCVVTIDRKNCQWFGLHL